MQKHYLDAVDCMLSDATCRLGVWKKWSSQYFCLQQPLSKVTERCVPHYDISEGKPLHTCSQANFEMRIPRSRWVIHHIINMPQWCHQYHPADTSTKKNEGGDLPQHLASAISTKKRSEHPARQHKKKHVGSASFAQICFIGVLSPIGTIFWNGVFQLSPSSMHFVTGCHMACGLCCVFLQFQSR